MKHPNRPIAAGVAAAGLSIARSAHAAGTELIRIALVGCGNRGSGAYLDALSTKAPDKARRAGRSLRQPLGDEPQKPFAA